jgi:hypothetical protein
MYFINPKKKEAMLIPKSQLTPYYLKKLEQQGFFKVTKKAYEKFINSMD